MNTMSAPATIHVLEERLRHLEEVVLGNPYASAVTGDDVEAVITNAQQTPDEGRPSQATVAQKLADLQRDVDKVIDSRTSIIGVFDKMHVLKKYTSAHYAVKLDEFSKVKEALVVNSEDDLHRMSAHVAVIEKYSSVLDSEHIVASANMQGDISKVAADQVELAEQVSSIAREVSELSSTYNDYVQCINKQFVYWDGLLKAVEAKKNTKK